VSDNIRRAVLILGVVAVLVGVGLASATSGGASSGGARGPTASASGTAVTARGAESSAWFCAGATAAGGDAQATMILTNASPRPVTGTITTVSSAARPSSASVIVPPRSQTAVAPAASATAGALAATVVLSGGAVGVSQVLSGPLGVSDAPCASTTASHWYFADASTASGSDLSLSLFNPTDTVAVVDVSFVSSNRVLAPPPYQGIEVPGNSLVVEDVDTVVLHTPHLATSVVALSGAVVAAELESAGQAGDGGPSVVLGAPTASPTWSFAQNTDVAQGRTTFHVFNPSTAPADVTVKIALQQGVAEPLVIRVPAGSVDSLDAQAVTRIPSGVPFAVTFVSRRGVGIVVDRHVSSPVGAPSPQQGDAMGVPGGAKRWLVPTEGSVATAAAALAVVNLNPAPVTISLSTFTGGGLVPLKGLAHRRVRSGTPLIVTPGAGSPIGSWPLELVSSAPVALEVDALPAGSPGVVVVPALPLL
jgi:hypothetical protein